MTGPNAQQDPDVPSAGPSPACEESCRGESLRKLAAAGLLLGVGVLLGGLIHRSRGWPMIQDPPTMHYVGWRITEGDVLYRDLYDGNFPGIYLLHAGLVKVFGITDAGFRCFDLLWLAGTSVVILLYCRAAGLKGGLAAAMLFAVFHLDGGALRAGQRDYLLVLFLIVSGHMTARYCEGRGGPRSLALAGVLIGLAVTIKPFVVLWGLILAIFAGTAARKRGLRIGGAVGALIAGGAVPLLATVVYLWWAGGLGAFVDILAGYMPLYAKMHRVSRLLLLDGIVRYRYVLVLLALAAAPYCRALFAGRLTARRGLLIGGLLYGLAHYLLQGKGWGYHLYPFVAFACLMVGMGGDDSRNTRPPPAATGADAGPAGPPPKHPPRLRWMTMVALLAALITGTFGALTYSDTFLRAQQRTRRKLVAEIRQRVGPGETVQMMDLTYGGLHALMETGAHQPTAMLYDFPLYESSDHPYVQSLRKRFLAELKARPPKLIVVFRLEGGWSAQGFDRPNRFPELDEWMQRTYSVEVKADRFWLYQRRPGVPAAKRSEND